MRLLFVFIVFLAACATKTLVTPVPAAPSVSLPAHGATYLALGDSYTIGEGAAEADRWPVQLAQLARQSGLDVQAPDIIARTGWTTGKLQAAVRAAHSPATYGLVSLLIGVNNQYRGLGQAAYRTKFRQLLAEAARLAGGRPGRVVVLSIPDWGQSPFAERRNRVRIGREIDQFNAVAQDECRRAGVAYVDITPATRAAAGDASQFTGDGLHYTGPQMRRWAQQALPVVQGLLK
ncbi:SGNH/GDSL hydrolase family protein [Hymenobacter caeli]|uniref:Lysophospholipase L1-like esterase n=1 Tax=Hymenobacter caeli TaxID=2735894 RepID=A0ABX2FT90_9BACT|nr:GDSL-type esterase/lipase family protein [Hymenobacter caeli]NRT20339.1 lysophospholipase L1-like esterase [Hymenobacter caeli]